MIRFKDALLFCHQSILLTPLRSALTVLGLSIGIGAILSVLTLGSAGQAQVEKEILRLGVDKIWITAAHESSRALDTADAHSVHLATGASASGRSYALLNVTCAERSAYGQIIGCDEETSKVHVTTQIAGRFLHPLDHRQQSPSAVIDESLLRALDMTPSEALGNRLRIGVKLFQVVGVIQDQSVQTFGGAQGCVYIPLSLFARSFFDRVDEITLSIPQGRSADELADAALAALAPQGSWEAVTLEQEIDAARSVIRIFVMVLAGVAAVCMLVGGIGVMNILLVSVRERRQEIGVIKALGGTRGQVCFLFLTEAVAYAVSGGALGILLGILLSKGMGQWIGLNASVDPGIIPPTLLAAWIVGILFGTVPAVRAAALPPVDALRRL